MMLMMIHFVLWMFIIILISLFRKDTVSSLIRVNAVEHLVMWRHV